jgi:hypothetical protein
MNKEAQPMKRGAERSGRKPKENKYIVAYPPVDFSIPFSDVPPEDIDIYFHYTNEIGKNTCRASCEHCYFKNRPTNKIPVEKAIAITKSLREQGYQIGMTPADNFSDEALTETAGSAFRLKEVGQLAWTSGAPLAGTDAAGRLDKAWDIGFRSIVISAHTVAGTAVPIKGVTKGPVINRAYDNIAAWNTANAAEGKKFLTSSTFTIRKDNCDLETMRQMVKWGVDKGIDLVRFNCFANFLDLPQHREYEMTAEDISRFYGYLAALQDEFVDSSTKLGISEDWGDAGIEQILPYLPPEWESKKNGWCRAGYRLFAMMQVENDVVITGCVDKWDPIMGKVVEESADQYKIVWDYDKIEKLRQMVSNDDVYACWGGVGNRGQERGFKDSSPIFRESSEPERSS